MVAAVVAAAAAAAGYGKPGTDGQNGGDERRIQNFPGLNQDDGHFRGHTCVEFRTIHGTDHGSQLPSGCSPQKIMSFMLLVVLVFLHSLCLMSAGGELHNRPVLQRVTVWQRGETLSVSVRGGHLLVRHHSGCGIVDLHTRKQRHSQYPKTTCKEVRNYQIMLN